ncbi:hypothetical protein CYD26_07005 [Pseudomonas sp. FFUP_PS_473]|uniref:DUF2780 domain-containing protein n=1 Tax=Pseudomonas TaxID=286 RepID=UPI000C18EB41|nr:MULTISPECIES: DUF2780 domain-containing protein [unclassified Pseudomonas]ATR85117.1 hypothetical protein CS390_22655 [Pseudomonas sp. HLS-6]MEE3634772.1 DUF2780 domain-containing protein [Pseudomonas sp. AL 58]PLP94890.1 hypothetical protein CYD26_07005 [Pseudomonas sp. FFUP_PS_473]WJM97139.1 DUF2780 domain-containing protein [Pseudomonas defluvii]
MKRFALVTLMTLAASPVFAFNLSDAANAVSAMQGTDSEGPAVIAAPASANLLNTLGSQLNITPEQAVGGTGALLGLAKNQLSGDEFSQLTQAVPGLNLLTGDNALGGLNGLIALMGKSDGQQSALSNALGNVKDTNDLNNAFSLLGMDTGLIGQFAPLLLQFLGQQGVANSLLQNLGTIWGSQAALPSA